MAATLFKNNANKFAIYFLFAVLIVIQLNSFKIKMSDFETYYFSTIMSNDSSYKLKIFQPAELCNYVKNVLHINGYYGGFTHPPNICLFYYPFTTINAFYAKLLNNLISILLFVFSLKRLFKHYQIELKWLWIIPIVFYFPFRSNIYFGQFYFILFSLMAESLLALELKKYNLSAFLLAWAIFTKIFPVIFIIYLLLAHPFKVSFKVALFTLLFFLISLGIQGIEIWKIYIAEVMPRLNFGEIHASFSYYFQTFLLFFKMLFVYDELRNPLALYDNYYLFLFSVILIKSLIMIFTVASTIKNIKNNLYNFSLWLLCALLLLPNSNTYTMIFLMFILLHYLVKYKEQPLLSGIIIFIILYISWVPAYKMMHMNYLLRYSKLIFTLLIFVILIYNEGVLMRLKPSLAAFSFVLLSTGSLFFRERKTNSSYLITQNRPELISKLYVKQNKLCYAYWSLDGEIHDSTDIIVHHRSDDKLELKNNQLVLNDKRITNSKDLKSAPVLIGSTIYYLSDFNQGYGFYTIRQLNLAKITDF